MWGHVDDRLAPFCEGALPEPEARSIAAHLAGCEPCEQRRREVEEGLALAFALPAARLPEDRAALIRRMLVEPGGPAHAEVALTRHHSPARWLKAAAAVLLVSGAVGVAYLKRSPVLRVEAARQSLTTFEETAVALQRQATQGTLALDLPSGSVPEVRDWVEERTGLSTSLALQGSADAGRFELLGAREVTVGGARAVAVAYRIDARPVVLLTARAEEVPDRPRSWNLVGKTVRHRIVSASGVRLLSWTNSGQVYALVSVLPGPGLESCFVCHTDPRRRALIRNVGSLPAPSSAP